MPDDLLVSRGRLYYMIKTTLQSQTALQSSNIENVIKRERRQRRKSNRDVVEPELTTIFNTVYWDKVVLAIQPRGKMKQGDYLPTVFRSIINNDPW
jgi:hypothetical protein